MRIAVITARGGSKRVPRKNITPFHGQPMIAWSIQAALSARIFDRVIVSTDDQEIAEIATAYGAEVPFVRPIELANDHATTLDVMCHATKWVTEKYGDQECICCIYPTAPFISASDLVESYAQFACFGGQYVFSACEFNASVYRAFKQGATGGVEMLYPEFYATRSQDLPVVMHDAAMFYWGTPNAWLGKLPVFSEHSNPYLIPGWRVLDIDTPEDLERAHLIAEAVFASMSG